MPAQALQQYLPQDRGSSYPLSSNFASDQTNAQWAHQYPAASMPRQGPVSRTQQVSSRGYDVASSALVQQSRIAINRGALYGTHGAYQYHAGNESPSASSQAQLYYGPSSTIASQPSAASSGRALRADQFQEQMPAPRIQQQRQHRQHGQQGDVQRRSIRTAPQPVFQSQPSVGLPLPTDYQSVPRHGVPQNVANWNIQPRAVGDRSTLPPSTHDHHHLHPPAQASSMSPSSSSGTSRRRDAAQMCELDGSNQHQCTYPECRKTYPSPGELSKHMRRCHCDNASRPHPCPVHDCPQRFNYPREVRRHFAARHADIKQFLCPYEECQYAVSGFARQDHLDRHLRSRHRHGSASASAAMSTRSSPSRTY
nr:krueppel-like factor 15 [Quercus suber]